MPKKLTILAVVLVLALIMATTAFAQEEHMGEGQYGHESGTFTITHAPPEETSYEGCVAVTYDPEACKYLRDGVAQEAKEAAIRAAEEAAGVQNYDQQVNQAKSAADIAAQQSTPEDPKGLSPAQKGAAAYLAALQAARDTGADDETARGIAANVATELPDEATQDNAASESETSSEEEDAKEVAAEGVTSGSGTTTGKASKANNDGSGESIAAAEGKANKRAAAQGKDREDKKSRKDKTRDDDTATDNASEEETTENTDDEVAASGENGGTGDEYVATTPAGSRVPLLLGGVAFLSVGGYAALLFVQSRSLTRTRRLLRN